MAPLAQLQDVTRVYPMGGALVHALRNLSFTLHEGEMTAVMGASGSGKSTLLNVLGTLDRPTSGSYRLDGTAVEGLDETALARLRNERLGFVFQSFNLLPSYSALENVELPMVYRGLRPAARRAQAEAALERVGLADRMDHRPSELSGGQQQRVAIARAIVNQPRILLADEPTGALDSATSKQVMELFGDLHAEGMTLLLVTHDAKVASYAERTVTFQDGRIVSDSREAAHV
ncbi:MAG: ABC transporter ATP-binding protein [Myxococcales bacterium]|nr:ABC transporter ATP-binding protein [Myxococcales bacterium]MCB9651715.1 ABC transporter ATP-binding protein [Deltaproteobacteria bacterium]